MSDARYYQDEPSSPAQAGCPHRLRNRADDECSTCGSKKGANGRWRFLTAAWFHYYTTGNDRPEPYVPANDPGDGTT